MSTLEKAGAIAKPGKAQAFRKTFRQGQFSDAASAIRDKFFHHHGVAKDGTPAAGGDRPAKSKTGLQKRMQSGSV